MGEVVPDIISALNPACSCILTAREEGAKIPPNTNAEDFQPNSTPIVGGLVLFKYTNNYHVAVIKELREDGMWVAEGNKLPCRRTERLVSWDDPFIRGFWVPQEAWITKYGPTGRPMSSGKMPFVSAVAVSDRSIPLGSRVSIDGIGVFVVEDYTALWVHERQGLTIDIFSRETEEEMLEFGRQKRVILIK